MSLSKCGSRSRKSTESPFRVPETCSLFLQSISEKAQRKQEMREFLSLPIAEKSVRAARARITKDQTTGLEEEEERQEEEEERQEEEEERQEEEEKIRIKQNKTVLPKQTAARRELKKIMMKRENITKDSKHEFMTMEREKAVLQLSVMTKRREVQRMDRAVRREERALKELESLIDHDNRQFEQCLKEHEKKSVAARTFFEREARSKQQKSVEIKRLTADIATTQSDLEKIEETLVDYKRYKDLLFALSPPEWQEAQTANANEGRGLEPVSAESSVNDVSTQSHTEPASRRPCDTSEYEEEPQLFFSDPQQLQDLLSDLTEQNLSLIQNSARVEETLEELRAAITLTEQNIAEDEEQLSVQIESLKQRMEAETTRGTKLRQKVQLHVSLNTQDQDVMLDALGEKVSEVHQVCVDQNRIQNLSTLERLAQIESSLSELLQNLESIPPESLVLMRRIKESEKRARQREEKLREQQEKQKERMRRYLERSMAEPKKMLKKKPTSRSVAVAQKVKVTKEEDTSANDELRRYLFPSDDSD